MVFSGFLYVNAMSKSVFVFYDFKMAEYKRCLKVVGKVFLMIKYMCMQEVKVFLYFLILKWLNVKDA